MTEVLVAFLLISGMIWFGNRWTHGETEMSTSKKNPNTAGSAVSTQTLAQQAQQIQQQAISGGSGSYGSSLPTIGLGIGANSGLYQQWQQGQWNGPYVSSTDALLLEIRDLLKRSRSRMGG